MFYLLSTQALLDALTDEGNVLAWVKGTPSTEIELSTVSIGQALQIIEAAAASRRNGLRQALKQFAAAAAVHQGVIPFDENAARIWAALQMQNLRFVPRKRKEQDLGTASRMVVATALARGATLVEEPQPYHQVVAALKTFNP